MTRSRHLLLERDMDAAESMRFCGGRLVWFSAPRPEREGANEDAALAAMLAEDRGVLAVADGAGGGPAGARAARAALLRLGRALDHDGALREAILRGFDEANEAVAAVAPGAATTLAVIALHERRLRCYHAGDSLALVVGQRGRRKLETLSHSPVGYAVEAGVLDEADALHHEERHLVSNLLGMPEMRVEVSGRLALAMRDTVLLASDGLSDNLHVEEIVEIIRKGPLERAAARLAETARGRMTAPDASLPSKPDDLTFVLYRPVW